MPAPRTTNPQSLRHLQEAYINYQRYESFLDEPQNLHWAVVLLFYSAVHLVDAYIAGKHPDVKIAKHEDRDSYIANQMSAITREYAKLKSASRGARYTFAEYDRARSVRLADECFRPIRIFMREAGFWWEVPDANPTE